MFQFTEIQNPTGFTSALEFAWQHILAGPPKRAQAQQPVVKTEKSKQQSSEEDQYESRAAQSLRATGAKIASQLPKTVPKPAQQFLLTGEEEWDLTPKDRRKAMAKDLHGPKGYIALHAKERGVKRAVKYTAKDLPKLAKSMDVDPSAMFAWVHLVTCDTISGTQIAHHALRDLSIAAHNLADPKTPGGRLFDGAASQEQQLCQCTNTHETIMDPQKVDASVDADVEMSGD